MNGRRNIFTQVLPVPCFLHFYTLGDRYREYVPHSWCFAYFCLTDYVFKMS